MVFTNFKDFENQCHLLIDEDPESQTPLELNWKSESKNSIDLFTPEEFKGYMTITAEIKKKEPKQNFLLKFYIFFDPKLNFVNFFIELLNFENENPNEKILELFPYLEKRVELNLPVCQIVYLPVLQKQVLKIQNCDVYQEFSPIAQSEKLEAGKSKLKMILCLFFKKFDIYLG